MTSYGPPNMAMGSGRVVSSLMVYLVSFFPV